MKNSKKPTSKDPLRRHGAKPAKRLDVLPPNTYRTKDGRLKRKKTLWFTDAFARSFGAYCRQQSVSESTFAEMVIQDAMKGD